MTYNRSPLNRSQALKVINKIYGIYGIKPKVYILGPHINMKDHARVYPKSRRLIMGEDALSDRMWFLALILHELAHILDFKARGTCDEEEGDIMQGIYGREDGGHGIDFAKQAVQLGVSPFNIQPDEPMENWFWTLGGKKPPVHHFSGVY